MKFVKQNSPLFVAATVIIIVIAGGFAAKLLWQAKQTPQKISVIALLSTIPIPTNAKMLGWRTFENDKMNFLYPGNWSIINNQYKTNSTIITFHVGHLSGSAKKLYQLQLYDYKSFDGKQGLVSTSPIKWLGQNSTLQEYEVEDEYLVLTTLSGNKQHQLALELGTGPVRASSSDSKLFLQIANTLKIK